MIAEVRSASTWWAPDLRASATSASFACAVMMMTGTRAGEPELGRLMVLTSAGPFRGCITSAAITRSGVAVAIVPMTPVGLSQVWMAGSDGGKHRPHDQKHRPPVVDHGDDDLVEIAAKRAMVQHGTRTDPPYRLFPRRNTLLACL